MIQDHTVEVLIQNLLPCDSSVVILTSMMINFVQGSRTKVQVKVLFQNLMLAASPRSVQTPLVQLHKKKSSHFTTQTLHSLYRQNQNNLFIVFPITHLIVIHLKIPYDTMPHIFPNFLQIKQSISFPHTSSIIV